MYTQGCGPSLPNTTVHFAASAPKTLSTACSLTRTSSNRRFPFLSGRGLACTQGKAARIVWSSALSQRNIFQLAAQASRILGHVSVGFAEYPVMVAHGVANAGSNVKRARIAIDMYVTRYASAGMHVCFLLLQCRRKAGASAGRLEHVKWTVQAVQEARQRRVPCWHRHLSLLVRGWELGIGELPSRMRLGLVEVKSDVCKYKM